MNVSGSARVSQVMDRNHVLTAAELYFRVALWMDSLGKAPTPKQIQEQFGVGLATAYRWRNAWTDARGKA